MNTYIKIITAALFIACGIPHANSAYNDYTITPKSSFVQSVYKINGNCSAVAIDENTLLTAEHCVSNKNTGQLFLDWRGDEKVPYVLIKSDKSHDIAEIEIHSSSVHLTPVKISKAPPSETDRVYIVGYPAAQMRILSEGYYSTDADVNGMRHYSTGANAFGGNSGGGLFNERGELIGITSKVAAVYHHLSLFVPLEDINEFIEN